MASITAAVALLIVVATQAPAATFDYLYIEANEGNSSGGHVALRLADHVYHFQHEGGLLRLRRDSWRRFEHHYRTLENRGVSVSRIETSPETYELLRSTFQRRYLEQEQEIKRLRELRSETRLLENLLSDSGGAPRARITVPGAGFFEAAPDLEDSPDARTIDALRAQVELRHGAAFLSERRRDIVRSIAALEPSATAVAPRFPSVAPLFHERLAELHAAAAALEVLQTPHRLRSDQLIDTRPRREVRTSERDRLRAAAAAQAKSLTRLVSSQRPDWGYPFLLGMARLVAIERSLAGGELLLLNAMPGDAKVLPVTARRRRAVTGILSEAESDHDDAFQNMMTGSGFDEAKWSELETAATRVAELRRVRAGASGLRVHPGILMPGGEAEIVVDPGRRFEPSRIAQWLHAARRRESEYDTALQRKYRYHLLTRNCVSEVFRTIETALLESGVAGEQLREASHRHLGGYVAPTNGLNFIPIVSAGRVRSTYSVTAREELPSFRRYQVERMRLSEPALQVDLRESNVWTSTLYTPSDEDGFFVFFTDRTVLLRPILGAVNLVASAAKSAVGVAALPIDRGRTLRAGLSGALFSLPELFFVNLRKGSNDYVAPALRPPGAP